MLALLLLALGLERMKQKIAMQAPTGLLFLVMVLMTAILLIWRKKFFLQKFQPKMFFLGTFATQCQGALAVCLEVSKQSVKGP
jgi:hypothetical protein